MLLRERPFVDPSQRRLSTPTVGDKVTAIGKDEVVYEVLAVGSKIYRLKELESGILRSEYKDKCVRWLPPEQRNENKTTLINEGKPKTMEELDKFFLSEEK